MASLVSRFGSWLAGSGAYAGASAPYGDVPVAWFTPRVTYLNGPGLDEIASVWKLDVGQMTPALMWRSQPHLRTVVDFIARNTAQLGVHVYLRDEADGGRKRDRTSPLARTLSRPNATTTTFELIYSTVGDMALYDRAYWWVGSNWERPTNWEIRRIPAAWVTVVPGDVFTPKAYRVSSGDKVATLPASEVLAFTGYSPTDPLSGSPTIDALKDILQEQVESNRYRRQEWKNGGRVSAVIEADKGALQGVSADQLDRFREDWHAQYTGQGPRAGGTPILPDGMTLKTIAKTARESQWAEGAKLALATVAAAYHVNPIMVGVLENATLANVREFRRMLYGETLGPVIRQIEERLTAFLVDMMGADPATYVEFNVAEKLRGSFEEQAAVMQTATGGPWMTRNEARSRQNLPAIDGADDLIVPLNVLTGGQASPTDSAPPKSEPNWFELITEPAGGQHA